MLPGYKPELTFDENLSSYVMKTPSSQQIAHDLSMAFYKDVEGKLRQALINLGWTPPDCKTEIRYK